VKIHARQRLVAVGDAGAGLQFQPHRVVVDIEAALAGQRAHHVLVHQVALQPLARDAVRHRVARTAAFHRDGGAGRAADLHQGAEAQVRDDQMAAEARDDGLVRQVLVRRHAEGRTEAGGVVQVQQAFRAVLLQQFQEVFSDVAGHIVEGRTEAAVLVALSRHEAVAERFLVQRRVHRGQQAEQLGARASPAEQPLVDRTRARGLVAVQQGRHRPRALALLAVEHDQRGTAELAQEVEEIGRDPRRLRIAQELYRSLHSMSGHSATGVLPRAWRA
jgi:hypothetical protein